MQVTMTRLAFLLAGMSMAATAQEAQPASGGDLNAPDTYFRPSWKSTCSVQGGPTTIAFTSAGGDATEDDMQVVATWPDGTATHLGLKPGLFPQSKGFSSERGSCEGTGVTIPRQDQMLLWIERDSRPAKSRMVLVLLDTNQRRVLDVVNDAGKELWGNELCLTKSQPGLYEAVLVGGYQARGQTAEPLDLPRIMRIEVAGNHLKLTWGDWVSKSHRKGKCFDS
jgi:hypothetical protein